MTLKGLAGVTSEVNSPHLGQWPENIGKFILNFAALELISYQYLTVLEPDRDRFNRSLDLLFTPRVNRLLELIAAAEDIQEDAKREMKELWESAKMGARWRNRIAHNPVLPTWKPGSDPATDPPEVLGIPDLRQLKAGDTSDSISLDLLRKLVDETCRLGEALSVAAAGLPRQL